MKIHVNEIDIFLEVSGEGFPVLLLHGYPLDHSIWEPILPFFSAKSRMIMPDLRGHGRSDAPDITSTMDLMAEDIAGLMDALDIKKAIIVGHSMGGYAAIALARLFLERVSGIGLVSSHARADNVDGRQARMEAVNQIRLNGLEETARVMPAKLTNNPELFPFLSGLIRATNPVGASCAQQGMAERLDSLDYLSHIKIPSLVVAGGKDVLIPLEKAKETAEKLPDCRLVVIPSAGHVPMLENPASTASAIADLIERVIIKERQDYDRD